MAKFGRIDKDEMHHLAMRFHREYESPSQGTVAAVFYFLLNRDKDGLIQLLREGGIEV
jgi:hypothetical protein